MAPSPLRQLFSELKRRRVYRVALVYLVLTWGLLQLGDIVVEPLRLPEWTLPLLIVLLVAGFPVAVVMAWAFDITPQGVKRTVPLGSGETGADDPGPGGAKVQKAALVGLGMLIALLGIGMYAFFQPPGSGPATSLQADDVRLSLAVLPFTNTSPEADNEFFADGVMEDILSHLALVPDFTVVSRTTVMRYKGSPLSVPEIAGELGVRYLLEGSVRRAGNQVRINAQLVDGRTDQPLWVETYDRSLEDIFAVQTEIATAIAGALEAELSSGVASRIERPPTHDLEAYDLFLRGRENVYLYTREGTSRAIEAFREALERDPDFALARAWLGRAFALYAFNYAQGTHWADSAMVQARRAVEDQPDLAAAHTALGTALAVAGRSTEAESSLERAVELNPNDWAATANLGLVYGGRGRHDQAILLTLSSLEREPARSHLAHANLGAYYGQLELLERAEASLRRALDLAPEYDAALFLMAFVQLIQGREDEALVYAGRLADRASTELSAALSAGGIYAVVGDAERAARILAPVFERSPTATNTQLVGAPYGWALEELGRSQEAEEVLDATEALALESIASGNESMAYPYTLAVIHALREERDQALRWLTEAVDRGLVSLPLLRFEAAFDGIRDDPRFQAQVARIAARAEELRRSVLAAER
jgi:adenylate cyclase